jgi:ATP/maltotriose-dependent transcriptional regulator MalT
MLAPRPVAVTARRTYDFCMAQRYADTDRSLVADRLSPREREVIELAASGLTNRQIAGRLQVSVHAVKFHLAATYQKLGVANRTQAAYVYLNPSGPVATGEGHHVTS